MTRRSGFAQRTWRALGVAVGALAIAAVLGDPIGAAGAGPHDPRTPIHHFVTLMQENHTFDNYFGTYPGADGIPDDVCMPVSLEDPEGECIEPFHLGGRPVLDLGHSRRNFEDQYNGGRMDGFVAAHGGTELPMGYYDANELPYYWNLADEFVLFDRFFSSSGGGSLSNHLYWISGAPGPSSESIPQTGIDLPTIFDRLQAADVSWKFYIQNYDPAITFRNLVGHGDRASQVVWAPVLTIPRFLDDPELAARIVDLDEYYADLSEGTLPAVSFLVPSGASEHPPGSLLSGQRFVQGLINSLARSSAWANSAFLFTYDDWGGWYDHVPPPQIDEFGYGFRVPALLVSPYARQHHIDHTELDFTSMLRFVEDNWALEPLGGRVATANSFVEALDFEAPPRRAEFISSDRTAEAERPEPNRLVLYASYAGSIGLALTIIALAGWSERRAKRRRP